MVAVVKGEGGLLKIGNKEGAEKGERRDILVSLYELKPREDKTRQDKRRHDKARHDTTRHDKTRQDKTR
jgi:hypothetical protein